MDTQSNKQLFIDALAANLPEGVNKSMLLDLADALVPSEGSWRQFDGAGQPMVQTAIRAYKKSHPKYKKLDPPKEVVIDWLLKRGGIRYAEAVEKKLTKIHNILVGIGEIVVDELVLVEGMKVLTMRVLSSLDPTLED